MLVDTLSLLLLYLLVIYLITRIINRLILLCNICKHGLTRNNCMELKSERALIPLG